MRAKPRSPGLIQPQQARSCAIFSFTTSTHCCWQELSMSPLHCGLWPPRPPPNFTLWEPLLWSVEMLNTGSTSPIWPQITFPASLPWHRLAHVVCQYPPPLLPGNLYVTLSQHASHMVRLFNYPPTPDSPSQDCAPHRLQLSFTSIFSALERLVMVGLHEGLTNEWMNEQNEILKAIVTWVIYAYVHRQNLSNIFIHDPQEEIYFILWLGTNIYIYNGNNSFMKLILHRSHSNIFVLCYAILCYPTLSYPISFHSIPLLYYLNLGFLRSRPWDTDSNANSLLWRWCQETPVEWGNETGKARQPVKV